MGAADEPGLFGTMLGHNPLSNSEFELNRESRGGILSFLEPQLAVALQPHRGRAVARRGRADKR